MKVGDLVKHPQGITNVCSKIYSCGLILKSKLLTGPTGDRVMQYLVWWCDDEYGPMQYSEDNLEVISESR